LGEGRLAVHADPERVVRIEGVLSVPLVSAQKRKTPGSAKLTGRLGYW
jgi:hypothetical protein